MWQFPLIKRFHEETKKPMEIPLDINQWPNSWKFVEFKEYPRFPSTTLPEPKELPNRFDETLKNRASRRNFDKNTSLTLQELSTFFYWSVGINRNSTTPEFSFRHHASGGARYPLEIYIALRGNAEIPSGVYHYNVKRHALELVRGKNEDRLIRALPSYPWVKNAAGLLFVTALFERSMRKYRERGYRFSLLEAGSVFHNFYLVAEALSLGCCGVGVNIDEDIERILDIESAEEAVVAHLAVGKLAEPKIS